MSAFDDFQQNLLGPLGKEYCVYFYILMIVSLVFILATVLGLFVLVPTIRNAKDLTTSIILPLIAVVFSYGLLYLQSRLLYNMCISSIQ